jgi:hypothetical protein
MWEELTTLLIPPAEPCEFTRCSWGVIESELGLPLPEDFKWFCDRYGPGRISYVAVLVPTQADRYAQRVRSLTDEHPTAYGEFEDEPSEFAFYPHSPGLFPICRTADAEGVWWLADRSVSPDRWPIVVTPRHETNETFQFQMGFCEFVVAWLRKQIDIWYLEVPEHPVRYAAEFPVRLDPAWQTPTVLALARGIHANCAFDRLPILADALQDAGCDNEDILSHCRGDGPHVRGCWVVDLVLGKE